MIIIIIKYLTIDIIMEQWTCPPHYGKKEYDSHGAVVKKKVKVFLLISNLLYNFMCDI
jgi:hypothetical protein